MARSGDKTGGSSWSRLVIALLLSVLFLYLALRGEDWQRVGQTLLEADYRWVLPMAGMGVFALFVRTQRWRLLLNISSGRQLPLAPLFSASAVGFMSNMLLPFRVGEVIRPCLASRNTGVPMSMAVATVVLERVLDLVALLGFALLLLVQLDLPAEVELWIHGAGVVALTAVVLLVVVRFNRERMLPLLDRIWGLLPVRISQPLVNLEHQFIDALVAVGDLRTLLLLLAWSFYVWIVIAASFSLGFPAFDLEIPYVQGGVGVTTLVALAVAVPSAPGFWGTFEYGSRLALESVYGIPAVLAVGYAFFTHFVQFSTQVVLGLVYLVKEGLSFGELGRVGKTSVPGQTGDVSSQ